MPSWVPLNFELLKNPLNWVIVALMLVIAGFGLHLLLPDQFPQANSGNALSQGM